MRQQRKGALLCSLGFLILADARIPPPRKSEPQIGRRALQWRPFESSGAADVEEYDYTDDATENGGGKLVQLGVAAACAAAAAVVIPKTLPWITARWSGMGRHRHAPKFTAVETAPDEGSLGEAFTDLPDASATPKKSSTTSVTTASAAVAPAASPPKAAVKSARSPQRTNSIPDAKADSSPEEPAVEAPLQGLAMQ